MSPMVVFFVGVLAIIVLLMRLEAMKPNTVITSPYQHRLIEMQQPRKRNALFYLLAPFVVIGIMLVAVAGVLFPPLGIAMLASGFFSKK